MMRTFLSTDLIFVQTVCIDAFVNKLPVANAGNGLVRKFFVPIFDRIVSNSNSTFLFGPRSHCNDLKQQQITILNFLLFSLEYISIF